MNCPATAQQSPGENELDSLNTFKSGKCSHGYTLPRTHTRTHASVREVARAVAQTLTRENETASYTPGCPINLHVGQVIDQLLAALVPCHGLSIMTGEIEKGREGWMDGFMEADQWISRHKKQIYVF